LTSTFANTVSPGNAYALLITLSLAQRVC